MAFSNGVAGSIFGPISSFFAVYACICYEYEEYWDVDRWNMGYRTTDFIITHLSSHPWYMALSNGVAGSIFGPIWSFFAVYACICYEYEEYWDADG